MNSTIRLAGSGKKSARKVETIIRQLPSGAHNMVIAADKPIPRVGGRKYEFVIQRKSGGARRPVRALAAMNPAPCLLIRGAWMPRQPSREKPDLHFQTRFYG